MKWLHRGALAAGVALFVFVVSRVGLAHLWQEAAQLGWGIALIVAIEGVADLLHTSAWRLCFLPPLPPLAAAAVGTEPGRQRDQLPHPDRDARRRAGARARCCRTTSRAPRWPPR